MITCPWHGWRFDLRSGACLTAGEDTQTLPVFVEGDQVLVDLDVAFGAGERGLRSDALVSALEAGDEQRAARNMVRLLAAGGTAGEIAPLLARFRPAMARASDSAEAPSRMPPHSPRARRRRSSCCSPRPRRSWPLSTAAERLASRPSRAAVSPTSARRACRGAYDRIAGRDADGAEAVVAGQLERGVDAAEVAALLAGAASRRFRGARPLTLVERAGRLAALDRDVARLVLPAAARDVAAAPAARPRRALRGTTARGRGDGGARARSRRLARGLRARARDRPDGRRLAARGGRGTRVPARSGWSGDATACAHAAWLADDARAWRGDPTRPHPLAPSELVARAADAGQSPAGAAIFLAATYAALELGVPEALAGVVTTDRGPAARALRRARARRRAFASTAYVDRRVRVLHVEPEARVSRDPQRRRASGVTNTTRGACASSASPAGRPSSHAIQSR